MENVTTNFQPTVIVHTSLSSISSGSSCGRTLRYIEFPFMGLRINQDSASLLYVFGRDLAHSANAAFTCIMASPRIDCGAGDSPNEKLIHIKPPSTTLPKPANSVLAPFLLSSSNSLMIPATMILRSFASAFAKISPVPGAHIAGEGMRPIIRV